MAEEKKEKLFDAAIKSIKDKFNEIKDSLNKDSFDNIKNDVVAKLEEVKRELEYNEKLDSVKTKMKDNVFLTVAISLAIGFFTGIIFSLTGKHCGKKK